MSESTNNGLILVMSEGMIRNNWHAIRHNPDNPRQDLETPDAFIAEIKAGNIRILGAAVILSRLLPVD